MYNKHLSSKSKLHKEMHELHPKCTMTNWNLISLPRILSLTVWVFDKTLSKHAVHRDCICLNWGRIEPSGAIAFVLFYFEKCQTARKNEKTKNCYIKYDKVTTKYKIYYLCYLHKKKQRCDSYASEKLSALFWQRQLCIASKCAGTFRHKIWTERPRCLELKRLNKRGWSDSHDIVLQSACLLDVSVEKPSIRV